MTSLLIRQVRGGSQSAVLLTAAVLAGGCGGDAGPEKYTVTGTVTYDGKPIPFGDIVLQPKTGVANVQSMSRVRIQDGRYTAEIIGGPHTINIRDLTGDIDMDPKGAESGAKPVLPGGGYRGEVDFAPLDQVKESPVEKDIEIPGRSK